MFSPYHGGERVKCGFYWNRASWEMAMIPKEGGNLPGDLGQAFVKIPIPLLLILGPVMGALYVVFLPFVGFALVLSLVARKTARVLQPRLAEAVTAWKSWRTGASHATEKTRHHS